MDVLAVRAAAQRAVERARAGEGPTLLECLTYRFRGHSLADPDELREEAEKEFWAKRDPIKSLASRLIEQVEQGDVDAGLLRFPVVRATQAEMTPVERDVFVAALPEGHPLLAKTKLKLSDLAKEPFVMYSAQAVPGLHAMALLACQQAGFVPKVQQEAVQVQTVVSLVESGLGVALVPSVATRHAMPRVVFRKVHGPGANTEIGIALLWRPDTETPAARRFRQTLASLENMAH